MTVAVGHWERGCEARVLSPRSRLVLVLVSPPPAVTAGRTGKRGSFSAPVRWETETAQGSDRRGLCFKREGRRVGGGQLAPQDASTRHVRGAPPQARVCSAPLDVPLGLSALSELSSSCRPRG